MSDKSGEAKEKAEGKPITDRDLEDISGGIVVQRPPATAVPPNTSGFANPPETLEWQDPPDIKN